ncbi:MAG: DUF1579 family protein [Fimbriimonas sp.]
MIPLSLALLSPPDAPAARQFDFWVGEWECVGRLAQGPGKWQETRGHNRIRKILDGKIIEENFEMPGLIGRSVSAYNAQHKRWYQTWVDNGGAYIALSGGMQGKEMILQSVPAPATPKAYSRMVFTNITRDGFLWRWEGTKDAGRHWTLQWELNYRRVKARATNVDSTSRFPLPLV